MFFIALGLRVSTTMLSAFLSFLVKVLELDFPILDFSSTLPVLFWSSESRLFLTLLRFIHSTADLYCLFFPLRIELTFLK